MTRRTIPALSVLFLLLGGLGLACNLGIQPTPAPSASGPIPTSSAGDTVSAATPTSQLIQEESASAVQAAIYGLAVYLGADPDSLSLVSAYETLFSDTALGCPRPGETPDPVATAGYTVILGDGEYEYEVHTSLDGLRVRCLSEDLRPGQPPASTGIVATTNALVNQEYGTLASLLPSSVALSTYPAEPQLLPTSSLIAQLRDIWLGPGDLRVDLNTNVLALMPSLALPSNHIPVFSSGWGAARNTDGILLFDLSGSIPVLDQVLLIPEAQKEIAYGASPAQEPEDKEPAEESTLEGPFYSLAFPRGWYSATVGSTVSLSPPGEGVAIRVEGWTAAEPPDEDQSFASWIESALAGAVSGSEGVGSMEPVWASSGQQGFKVIWHSRRADGVLETSNPVALFEHFHQQDGAQYYALGVSLLDPAQAEVFDQVIRSLSIAQMTGIPADMNVYRHDTLGYRIQFPADWELLPSPLGAAFRPPEQDVAVTIGPWPIQGSPAPGQSFQDWVAAAPAAGILGYGPVEAITPVETTGGDTGYLATWQVTLADGNQDSSNPAAIFALGRQLETEDSAYYALTVSLHVPTYTQTFERMVATLVIETRQIAEMVLIPAGPFVRGSNDAQIGAWSEDCGSACRSFEFNDEGPQRLITLDAFYIDRTEVTVAQFKEFVQETSYLTTAESKNDPIEYTWRAFDWPDRQNQPVRWVSWYDANAYCQWAGKRLPTEAEWEKAARGEDGRTWPWGNEWRDDVTPQEQVVAVDAYPGGASPYGVLGMSGNVWEWVADWYSASYYGSAPELNPAGPPESTDKVLRGGGFNNAAWALRAAHRHFGGALGYATDHGFRCASN